MICSKKGFTLLELFIVMALMGTAIALMLPKYKDLTPEARVAATQAKLHTLRSAVALYAGKVGGFPSNLDSLVSGGFLKGIPREMIKGKDKVTVNPRRRPNFRGGWVYFSDLGEVRVNVNRRELGKLIPGTRINPYRDW